MRGCHWMALWLIGLLALAGCTASPPTATPPPTVADDSPAAVQPDPALLAARRYLGQVQPYTAPSFIALAPEMSVDRLEEIVAILEALEAPPELEPAHATLVKGYRAIAEGRRLLAENVRDNLLRAEGRTLTDFGQVLLREHVQLVAAYTASLRAEPRP